MDEKDQKLRGTLEKSLQKAFKTLQSFCVPLESTLRDSSVQVSSLSNLLEQYEVCRSVEQTQLPFHKEFPDLRMQLQVKLAAEISEKQEELRKMILKDMEEKTNKFHRNSLGIISRGLSVTAITAGTSSSPPLADMVEWLEVVSRMLHEHYHCKLHLLDSIMEDEAINSGNLLQMWRNQDDVVVKSLKADILAKVGTFLEENR